MSEKILKYKWYLISGLIGLAIALLVVYQFLSKDGADKGMRKLTKWAVDKRLDMAEQAIEKRKDKAGELRDKDKAVEKKVQDLRKKREVVDREVDQRSLKELDDAWKDLGF